MPKAKGRRRWQQQNIWSEWPVKPSGMRRRWENRREGEGAEWRAVPVNYRIWEMPKASQGGVWSRGIALYMGPKNTKMGAHKHL